MTDNKAEAERLANEVRRSYSNHAVYEQSGSVVGTSAITAALDASEQRGREKAYNEMLCYLSGRKRNESTTQAIVKMGG